MQQLMQQIEHLPCWTSPVQQIAPLPGITQGSVAVLLEKGERYIVRLQNPRLHALGIQRRQEQRILEACSVSSLASYVPTVVARYPRYLVLHWLAGEPLIQWQDDSLCFMAEFLKQLHALPVAHLPRLDLKNRCQFLLDQIVDCKKKQKGTALFQHTDFPDMQNPVIAHHDLHVGNVLIHHNHYAVIDWEYAAVSDVALELALFLSTNRLSSQQKALFLHRYLLHNKRIINNVTLQQQIKGYQVAITCLQTLWQAVFDEHTLEENPQNGKINY